MPKKLSAKSVPISGRRVRSKTPLATIAPLPPAPPLQVASLTSTQIETQIIPLTLIACSLALLVVFGSSMMAGIVNMAGAIFTTDQYFLVKEAEHFNNEGSASRKDDGDGFYVLMAGSPGRITTSTKITLSNISLKTGQYNLWVKVIADATDRDSFMYKLPGQQNFLQHTIPTTSHSPTWQWRKIPFSYTVSTSTTANSLSLAWRETKQFDKVIITDNLNFVPQPGRLLIGWWRFDTRSSYPIDESDYSGFGNTAINVNGVGCIYPGISGVSSVACSFSSFINNQYLDISRVNKFFNHQGGTISAWVHPLRNTANSFVINGVGKNSNRYYIQWTNGSFRVIRGSDAAVVTLASNVQLDNWYHVAISWTENEVFGYFNGRLVGSAKYTASGTPAYYVAYKDTPKFQIGNQYPASDSRIFEGNIDEVRFYGEKLSNNEINLIYEKDKALSCSNWDAIGGGDLVQQSFIASSVFGFLGNINLAFFDKCISTSTLSEGICINGQVGSSTIACANGCNNGACNKIPVCTDSDLSSNQTWPYPSGQSDPFMRGATTGMMNGMTTTTYDVCANGSQLNEFYCSGGQVVSTGITCENGCNNGACNRFGISCNTIIDDAFVAKYGKNVVLQDDILDCVPTMANGLSAILIKTSDVTFDCNSHIISQLSTATGAKYGIRIQNNDTTGKMTSGVTIKNCIINGFKGGSGVEIYRNSANILNNQFNNNDAAISLGGPILSNISNNTIKNSKVGIVVRNIGIGSGYTTSTKITNNLICESINKDIAKEVVTYNGISGNYNTCSKTDSWMDSGIIGTSTGCLYKCQ